MYSRAAGGGTSRTSVVGRGSAPEYGRCARTARDRKVLLAGGCVLTLGARTPNHKQADVLIDGDVIAEIGTGLRARDAEQVDATGTIVMPGFVDTHRHAWTSLFRNQGDRDPSADPAGARPDGFGPDDVYAATLIGLLGAAEAGITTVVDWSHTGSDHTLAEAALRAHQDAGLRTVFVDTGGGVGLKERVSRLTQAAGPTTTIAFGSVAPGPAGVDAAAAEWASARRARPPHPRPCRSERHLVRRRAAR